jgi:hypothetical protein
MRDNSSRRVMRDNSSSNNRIKINYNAAFGLVINACICVTDSTVLHTHTS